MQFDEEFKTEEEKELEANVKLVNYARTADQLKAIQKIESLDDIILAKYETIQKMGKGAYGICYKAKEKFSNKSICVKKIFDAFKNDTDAQRTFREVFILNEMGEHANIVKICNLRAA